MSFKFNNSIDERINKAEFANIDKEVLKDIFLNYFVIEEDERRSVPLVYNLLHLTKEEDIEGVNHYKGLNKAVFFTRLNRLGIKDLKTQNEIFNELDIVETIRDFTSKDKFLDPISVGRPKQLNLTPSPYFSRNFRKYKPSNVMPEVFKQVLSYLSNNDETIEDMLINYLHCQLIKPQKLPYYLAFQGNDLSDTYLFRIILECLFTNNLIGLCSKESLNGIYNGALFKYFFIAIENLPKENNRSFLTFLQALATMDRYQHEEKFKISKNNDKLFCNFVITTKVNNKLTLLENENNSRVVNILTSLKPIKELNYFKEKIQADANYSIIKDLKANAEQFIMYLRSREANWYLLNNPKSSKLFKYSNDENVNNSNNTEEKTNEFINNFIKKNYAYFKNFPKLENSFINWCLLFQFSILPKNLTTFNFDYLENVVPNLIKTIQRRNIKEMELKRRLYVITDSEEKKLINLRDKCFYVFDRDVFNRICNHCSKIKDEGIDLTIKPDYFTEIF